MLLSRERNFTPVCRRHRVFRTTHHGALPDEIRGPLATPVPLESHGARHNRLRDELQRSCEDLETDHVRGAALHERGARDDQRGVGGRQFELRRRTDEVDLADLRLESLLSTLSSAIVLVDTGMLVMLWNRAAEPMWGLRAHEVIGRCLLALDIGIPMSGLQPAIRSCLDGGSERQAVEVDAVHRTGRSIRLRVVCTSVPPEGPPAGVVISFDEIGG